MVPFDVTNSPFSAAAAVGSSHSLLAARRIASPRRRLLHVAYGAGAI
jgi:hypothetical protein